MVTSLITYMKRAFKEIHPERWRVGGGYNEIDAHVLHNWNSVMFKKHVHLPLTESFFKNKTAFILIELPNIAGSKIQI